MNSFYVFSLKLIKYDLKLYEGFCSSKISLIISRAIPFLTLQISVTRTCKFFWCILTDQEVQKSSNYSDKLI